MALAADACGGPNALVSLANTYRTAGFSGHSRYDTQTFGSHSISSLLKHVDNGKTESCPDAQASSSKLSASPEHVRAGKEVQQKKSLNQCFSEFTVAHEEASVRPGPLLNYWRPHQRYSQKRQSTDQRTINKNFADWIQRYHPEVLLKMRASEVIDVELSHDLAEQWLKDFHIDDVIQVKSLSEAEIIVEQWIREFRLGRETGRYLSPEERAELERNKSEYEYVTENHSSAEDIFTDIDRGIGMIKQGDLMSAISVFEGVVQRDNKCGEAWYYLGLCHQQSENEPLAISAFNKVEEDDVCYPSTLLGLAASYLNEYKHAASTDCIIRWLNISNPTALSNEGDVPVSAATLRATFTALPRSPHNNIEISTALGILSCLLDEPHVAVGHFRDALAHSPNDFMLWNRLGATLANSDRSSESVHAYRRALSLSPGYIRARYNLGIACLNLRAYREGIEHFLTCLKQQESEAVWQTLRLALSLDQHYNEIIHIDTRALQPLLEKFNIV